LQLRIFILERNCLLVMEVIILNREIKRQPDYFSGLRCMGERFETFL
jgi:hypothetical protein